MARGKNSSFTYDITSGIHLVGGLSTAAVSQAPVKKDQKNVYLKFKLVGWLVA